MELKYTVYCHIHTESQRKYTGITKYTMMHRWNQHCAQAMKSKGGRWHFPNAIRKYGKEAFEHEIWKECPTLEMANAYENYYIDLFRTRDPECGFNLAKGGEHKPHSHENPWDRPEYRAKSELAAKKRWQDPDFRAKLEAKQKEVHSRPEWKASMSTASKQAFSKPEVREKHSNSLKGRPVSEETRRKISAIVKARHADPEFRKKLSDVAKKRCGQPEYRERQSAARRGKKLSAEHKMKISAANRSSDPEVRAKISASNKKRLIRTM